MKIKWALLIAMAIQLGCVTAGTKVKEAESAGTKAKESGFVNSPVEAVRKEGKSCATPAKLKWELKLTDKGPFIQQEISAGKYAYAPYQVFCFSLSDGKEKKIKIFTKHQGGGYGKAFYVLPEYHLFTHDFKEVKLSQTLNFKQQPWTGDYMLELPFTPKIGESYLMVIEANNRHPELTWNQYANTNLGWAIQGLFPIEVYSSVYGAVTVEIPLPVESSHP